MMARSIHQSEPASRGFSGTARLSAWLLSGTMLAVSGASPIWAQEVTELGEITVTNEGQDPFGPGDGYVADATTTGSKTVTPIREIPLSVSVVTRQQIDDRQPAQLEDALSYTPGVTTSIWGVDDRFDQFLLRGFDVGTAGIFRDGLSQKVIDFSGFKIEPYAVERVEVLKGPVGVLYGEKRCRRTGERHHQAAGFRYLLRGFCQLRLVQHVRRGASMSERPTRTRPSQSA
ncbi:TonB-dependent receptor plug domain-containing protein [Roseibium salinum]|nr:TonB-dependent receptor plug domain-containing protein [Roseibium salinum]